MRRSRLLTYWTGKGIEKDPTCLNAETRQMYVERLWSILSEGLWMNHVDEELIGWKDELMMSYLKEKYNIDDTNPFSAMMKRIAVTCFTERRLTQSKPHNDLYGLLGIVVDRTFVLERHGAPVFYVRSHPDESIVGNLFQTYYWIEDQEKRGADYATQVLENFSVPLAFVKAMSKPSADDFEYLDENEWRIVHTYRIEERGLIVPTNQDPPKYKIPLKRTDLKMLVLPDSIVKELVAKDARISEWFNNQLPPILTVEDFEEL